ncbi:MAG TPA: SCO family protein [Pyrinomonadaceae bacterium]|jgi:protein SCO1/2|nr:SCO family protein [Pyrinomonadaceae bacterium]
MRNKHLSAAALLAVALLICAAPSAHAQVGAASAAADKNNSGDFYSCPMHPEVKSKKKGTCPKCKMDLRLTHPRPKPSDDATKAGTTEATSMNVNAATEDAHAGYAHDGSSKMTIPDVELLDQNGNKVRFYSDLVKGKTVAVNFIFTTCTTICPPLGATFARVQKELGERAGRDVRLISISVDPATDTPERLKAWAAKFHAAEGWTLVTGAKPQVDELLRALGAATASPADHSPTVLIGNDAKGQWTRTYGLARPAVLVKLINDAVEGRLNSSTDSAAKE